MKRYVVLIFCLIALVGCSTPGRALLLGAGIGLGTGAGLGLMAPPGRHNQYQARNVIVGAAFGALLGAGAGFVANELIGKASSEAYQKGKAEIQKPPASYVGSSDHPNLLPPRVEARFVEEQVRGGTLIPAHVEYIIVEPARWSR